VRAGVSNFSQPLSSDAEQDRGVSSFRIHPGYTGQGKSGPDDVAVLALVSPLDTTGSAVQAVALPTPGTPFPTGATVSLAGFGRQSPTANASGPLSSMTATVDAQGTCGSDSLLDDNADFLCISSSTSAACNGDSGSGLVTTGGTPVLIGVASAGDQSCPPGSHTLFSYTGSPEILQFIQGNDHPPTAPRNETTDFPKLGWDSPARPVVGDTFDCDPGDWKTPDAQIAYSFVDAGTGHVLQSGPRGSFLVPAADAGAMVYCLIGVSNSGGTTLVRTTSTDPVGPVPTVRIVRVAPLEGSRGGTVSLRITLIAAPGLHGKFAVCLAPPPSVAGRLCKSTVNNDGEAETLPFVFQFRVKLGAPRATLPVAISAVAGLASAKTATTLRVS
jgi:hypothetical protein